MNIARLSQGPQEGTSPRPTGPVERSLTSADFSRLFGTSVDQLPNECRALIDRHDFRYRVLEGPERDAVLVDVLRRIESDQFSLAGKEGKPRWEKGWAENLESFLENGRDLSALIPKYIRLNQPLRLEQNYILPSDARFELNWYEVFRLWLFKAYLGGVENVYEFGCGSGFNLAVMASLFPDKSYVGLDWAGASRDIVNELAKSFGWKMKGLLFDFFAPDEKLTIPPKSAVVTIGALEQTGRDTGLFLDYLQKSSAEICIHIEPVLEWYEESNLVDLAAIRFHKKRRYWEGFPARLSELEKDGKVQILKMKRAHFGSLYLEGYSQIIWRPVH
jgi:SAM-dependent methyltransferase